MVGSRWKEADGECGGRVPWRRDGKRGWRVNVRGLVDEDDTDCAVRAGGCCATRAGGICRVRRSVIMVRGRKFIVLLQSSRLKVED